MRNRTTAPVFLMGMVLTLAIAGCGSDGDEQLQAASMQEEAFEVGFAFGIAERCGLDHTWTRGMPSKYDDSRGSWVLAKAFHADYAKPRGLDKPCIYGIEGRPPRR